MTRVAELRELGDEELLERLESLKEELFNLRFQLATGQLDNPMRIKQVRHELARILTLLRERELELELEEVGVAAVRSEPGPAAEGPADDRIEEPQTEAQPSIEDAEGGAEEGS